ncbi:hypothetical protein BN946_scf184651.g1 [Trametes cinnabarina]|uniref:Reverse transcriptase domain-containing protein n=1 Tax=Pycnoporus cinnabarinus TaxID=5643 RepID=A0A060STF6_PYCCI|nr:hypothetical protein BN946_scf184651.g1 [Trametes cinnabarina]
MSCYFSSFSFYGTFGLPFPFSFSVRSSPELPGVVPLSFSVRNSPELPESYPSIPPSLVPQVTLVNTAAFLRACQVSRSESYTLNLSAVSLDSVKARSSSVEEEVLDLTRIPLEYHEFADVFSKKKADTLPEHWPYDLKITLEEGKVPPLGPIYSLSQMELDTLCKIYIKLDLCYAYNLVCITPGDEWKTASRTWYSSFKWLMVPFGLSNTLAAFQRFVNEVFADLLYVWVVVYLNDILIYSNSLEKHQQHIKEVLWRLRKFKLFARADSDLRQVSGYILFPEGLTMAESKMKFIYNYSKIVLPLTRLTHKGVLCNFNQCCRDSFNALKKAFTTILHHWEPNCQITV